MTRLETYSFIGRGDIIGTGEATSANISTREATGGHITGVLGQGLL